eukprot:8064063-Pyramimonas_sp.AAC.1
MGGASTRRAETIVLRSRSVSATVSFAGCANRQTIFALILTPSMAQSIWTSLLRGGARGAPIHTRAAHWKLVAGTGTHGDDYLAPANSIDAWHVDGLWWPSRNACIRRSARGAQRSTYVCPTIAMHVCARGRPRVAKGASAGGADNVEAPGSGARFAS